MGSCHMSSIRLSLGLVKPSLNNAYFRVDRAKQHLASIERELLAASVHDRERLQTVKSFVSATYDPIIVIPPAPPIFGVLVGEAVYNLRAALDYLIFELSFFDTRSIQDGTQFPIEDTSQGWRRRISKSKDPRRPNWCEFLTPIHQAAIMKLQPCAGCKWTGMLRSLSNPDKHRTLTIVQFDTQDNAAAGVSHTSMYVSHNFTIDITFDDGAPVIKTLQILQAEVTSVLDSFKTEFQIGFRQT